MAKVIITLTDDPRGLDVQCRVESTDGDSERVLKVATAVSLGLAGHVNEKIRAAIKNTQKGNNNVH